MECAREQVLSEPRPLAGRVGTAHLTDRPTANDGLIQLSPRDECWAIPTLVSLRRSSYTLPLASLTRVSRGIKLTRISCGSGALAAITGCTRGASGLIAARAPLPQRRFVSMQKCVHKFMRRGTSPS